MMVTDVPVPTCSSVKIRSPTQACAASIVTFRSFMVRASLIFRVLTADVPLMSNGRSAAQSYDGFARIKHFLETVVNKEGPVADC